MCGITLVPDTPEYAAINSKARGPDVLATHSVMIGGIKYQLRFYRLAVFGGKDADQPFQITLHKGVRHIYACNGEIFNWKALNDTTRMKDAHGDCWSAAIAVSRAGWQKGLEAILGEFALVQIELGHLRGDTISIACDTFGVRPLFYGFDHQGRLLVTSTMLGVPQQLTSLFQRLRGGTFLRHTRHNSNDNVSNNYGTFSHTVLLPSPPADPVVYFQNLFLDAVKTRCVQIQPDQKIGVLLSGGADSIAVIAAMGTCIDPNQIVAFTVSYGDIVTPDVEIACEACINIGVGRHVVIAVPEEALTIELLKESIRALHTFDTTTIRAGTIQYLLYKLAQPVMQEEGVKALLSGEGADELAGGYQYFKMAPDPQTAVAESDRLLKDICLYDGLRADRTAGAFGKEVRLPFLDVRLVDCYQRFLPAHMRWNPQIEKHLLRNMLCKIDSWTFQTQTVQRSIQRPKDALSDSVGKKWVEQLKVMAAVYCKDRKFPEWLHCPPRTDEERMYRSLFDEVCGGKSAQQIPYFWMPKWQPAGSSAAVDPSATLLPCFTSSEEAGARGSKPQGIPPGMPSGMPINFPPNMHFSFMSQVN